ncbi:MAG TPA: ester cyclase [Planococcus sp. (in: firmicutes)]|nr:ester cyclase [Planococcus sp. (in: firmicutes)]
MASPEKRQIITRWLEEVYVEMDLSVVDELMADEIVTYLHGHQHGYKGRESFKNWLLWHRKSFVKCRWLINDTVEEKDKIVMRFTTFSHYKGGVADIPCINQQVKESGIIIFLIRDHKIYKQWLEISDLDVLEQLKSPFN